MGDYARDEAARRAGVERAYLDRLVQLDIITPVATDWLTAGDLRRVQLAQTLETAGIPLETQAGALKRGLGSLAFMDSPVYERFAALADETFEDLSRRTGVPLNLLMLIREMAGGAVPDPTDRVREDELAVVPWIELELRMGFRPVSVERVALFDNKQRFASHM